MNTKEADQYMAESKELQAIFYQAHEKSMAALERWNKDRTPENWADVSETSRQSEKAFDAMIHLIDKFVSPAHPEETK